MLERCVRENFMHEKHLAMGSFVDRPEEVIESLIRAAPWDESAINFATNK